MIFSKYFWVGSFSIFAFTVFLVSSAVSGMADTTIVSNSNKKLDNKKVQKSIVQSNSESKRSLGLLESNKSVTNNNSNQNKNEVCLVPPPLEIPMIKNDNKSNFSDKQIDKSKPANSNIENKNKVVVSYKVTSSQNQNKYEVACNTISERLPKDLQIQKNKTSVGGSSVIQSGTLNKNKDNKLVSEIAKVDKPRSLFTFRRLLNFDQRPQEEELLKNDPIIREGKKIWFKIKYLESWRNVSDLDAYLEKIAFQVTVMNGDKPMQVIKTPFISVSPKTVSKGKILSVVELSPYRLVFSLDQYNATKDGVADIVYKLDLIG